MDSVETQMKESLCEIFRLFFWETKRTKWIKDNLGMMTLLGSQVWWTWEVEDVFNRVRDGNKYAMKDFSGKLTNQLVDLTGMVRSDLTKEERKKVNQLIIIDVHARDIIDVFIRDSVLDVREFAWESQLRFNWDRKIDDVVIRQCTGEFRYGYEYMNLNGRLVITALTDRCYMTITTALTYRLGGAPAGPQEQEEGDGEGPRKGNGPALRGVQLRRGSGLQGHGKHLQRSRAVWSLGLLRRV